MAELKPYSEYKDSGIQWIGEIPETWKTVKLKYLSSIITGNTPPKSDVENYINGTYPWVKPDNFNIDYTISETKEKLSEKGAELARIIPKHSALVCCIGTVGKVSVNESPITTNQQINSIIFDKQNFIYKYGIYAAISAEEEFQRYSNKVVIAILNKTAQENVFMPLPSLEEQGAIGKYIMKKTSEIDALISDKKRLIALLEEKRQAVITETVTKGLDPNVPMKDSGIEWIEEIPEHWKKSKLKYLSSDEKNSFVDGPFGSDLKNNEYVGAGIPVIQLNNIRNGKLRFDNINYVTDKKSRQLARHIAFPGNIVIAKMASPLVRSAIVSDKYDKYIIVADCIKLNLNNKMNNQFLNYLMNTSLMESQAEILSKGTTRIRVNLGIVKNLAVSLPPHKEQLQIVECLNEITVRIDKIKSEISLQMSKLQEYRESLIYEAVTGKIDVRDYAKEMEEVN